MKYIIYNDISYLYHKRKNILLMILLLPLLVIFLYINSKSPTMSIMQTCVGANFDIANFNIVSLLMFLFNSFSFIYLIIDVYIKDLDENLENIFLRTKPIKYILKKNLSFTISVILVKAIQYIFMILLLLIFHDNVISLEILKLFTVDILYILLLIYLFLLIYLIYLLLKKNIYVLSILSLILFICFPKNIWNTRNYTIYIVILIVITYIFINWIFLKKSKKLIENI